MLQVKVLIGLRSDCTQSKSHSYQYWLKFMKIPIINEFIICFDVVTKKKEKKKQPRNLNEY